MGVKHDPFEGEQLEYTSDLAEQLIDVLTKGGTRMGMWKHDNPVYARTPHGTYRFVITKVEEAEKDGETVTMLVLQEVAK